MASISLDDSNAVVIIGSGAGGGTLAHELTRRGIKVVLLEAGARQSLASFSQVPGEAFAQLTWLEPRTQSGTTTVVEDYPTLPSWTAKTVGGTTVHWTGTALACPRLGTARPQQLRRGRGRFADRLAAGLWELLRYYGLAEKRMVVTRRNGNPGLPASNHFKVFYYGAKRHRLPAGAHRLHGDQFAAGRRSRHVHPTGFLRSGVQDRRQMEHAVHRNTARRGDRQPRIAGRMPRAAHRAWRRQPSDSGRLSRPVR